MTPAPFTLAPASLEQAAAFSRQQRGSALLIVQDGREVFAEGENGFDLSRRHLLASGSKSFGCALAVTLLDRGLLSSLDERASDTLSEWRADPQRRQITVRQLLSFTSGLPALPEQGPAAKGPARLSPDLFGEGLDAPLVSAPGARFTYSRLHLGAFGLLVQRKTRQDPAAYLQREVLGPIGAQAVWARDRKGQPGLASSALMTARDWARYGQLIVQGGQWQGRPVLGRTPQGRAGLEQCFWGSAAQPAYGLTWWLNVPSGRTQDVGAQDVGEQGVGGEGEDGSGAAPLRLSVGRQIAPAAPTDLAIAAGALNQRLYLLPDRHMVVVRFGEGGPWSDQDFLERLLAP